VLERFEIERPEQVIDFLGMMGDAVDNIPGLPGVGEVTAKKLLKEFGLMENLLENTDKLKGQNEGKHREQQSAWLALQTTRHHFVRLRRDL
jgi:5'-3' exonuclease